MQSKTQKFANIFKALACETRLKIVVGLLNTKECNVNNMAVHLGIAQPNVSQHLAVLKNAGIIEGYRNGNQICYRVVDDMTEKIINNLNLSLQIAHN